MAYITQTEYVDRYGEAETIRLTDEDRTRVIDTAKLAEALEDASDFIDGYLAKRYAVPLASAPRLVKGMNAILGRELLHKSLVMPALTEEADRVRQQLKDIARGIMSLPIDPAGVEEATTGSGMSYSSGDGPRPTFSDESFSGFLSPGGSPVACWRR